MFFHHCKSLIISRRNCRILSLYFDVRLPLLKLHSFPRLCRCSVLQWRWPQLGLGLGGQQHPGRVRDPPHGVCPPHLPDGKPRLLPEGRTPVSRRTACSVSASVLLAKHRGCLTLGWNWQKISNIHATAMFYLKLRHVKVFSSSPTMSWNKHHWRAFGSVKTMKLSSTVEVDSAF